ncbi:MAG TPA: hypothetical protein DEU93_06335 [Chitinophagaceae bacterium]|nr:hypothetical protein [Chitinophagaceae bacterium]
MYTNGFAIACYRCTAVQAAPIEAVTPLRHVFRPCGGVGADSGKSLPNLVSTVAAAVQNPTKIGTFL